MTRRVTSSRCRPRPQTGSQATVTSAPSSTQRCCCRRNDCSASLDTTPPPFFFFFVSSKSQKSTFFSLSMQANMSGGHLAAVINDELQRFPLPSKRPTDRLLADSTNNCSLASVSSPSGRQIEPGTFETARPCVSTLPESHRYPCLTFCFSLGSAQTLQLKNNTSLDTSGRPDRTDGIIE